jgi:hypothetical protein
MLGSAMFLRVPYEIGGSVTLEPLMESSSYIRSPQQTPCKIEVIQVKVNQLVKFQTPSY